MILKISARTQIRGTPTCWQVEQRRKDKGKLRWRPTKYYTTLDRAVRGLAQREIRLAPTTTLAEAITAADAIVARYTRLLDEAPNTKGCGL